jgi:hypothetical protein
MCIAIVIPLGATPPPRAVLEKCFARNPHGAGFAWCGLSTGEENLDGIPAPVVKYRKGFPTFKSFWAAYVAAGITGPHLIHFRLASMGGPGPEFSHPFPLTTDLTQLYATYGESGLGVIVHNGTVPGLGITGGLSDSQVLAKRLARGIDLDPEELEPSRVAMLTPSGDIQKLGAWVPGCYGPPGSPECLHSNYGHSIPLETLGYRLKRWLRGLTADRDARDHAPNTGDRGLVVVDLKGRHREMHTLISAVGGTGGFYVDPDRRVYLMSVKPAENGVDTVCTGGCHRIGSLGLYRVVPPVPKKRKQQHQAAAYAVA